uniref:C-type lectin domain-containing protein n=1 Tax=Steinernema glaseri TaxID=37863 RepID=A0A1I8AGH4_9BILA
MVRIFKELNGSFNSGIYDLEKNRYQHWNPSPLPLWKSSLSATFSKESALFMVRSPLVERTYNYLRSTHCPDETFWTTIAGNPHILQMPGGFNASLWKEKLIGAWDKSHPNANVTLDAKRRSYGLYEPETYYIARYQIWNNYNFRKLKNRCLGKFTAESCAFGVDDLPTLANRPELIGHKFYTKFQPAAFFCLYEHVRQRALSGNTDFNVSAYGELPGPKLLSGTSHVHKAVRRKETTSRTMKFVVLSSVLWAVAFSACDSGWSFFPKTNSCYRHFNEQKSFNNAQTSCRALNASLASVGDINENNFIRTIATMGGDAGTWGVMPWLGGYTESPNETPIASLEWKWNDGSAFGFTNWCPGDPNSSHEKCIHMVVDQCPMCGSYFKLGCWNNLECHNIVPYICKKPNVAA